jgi:hypothetical protein
MTRVYSLPPGDKPVRYCQRDKLRDLRGHLRRYWRRLRSGSTQRRLCADLIAEVDRLLRREVTR